MVEWLSSGGGGGGGGSSVDLPPAYLIHPHYWSSYLVPACPATRVLRVHQVFRESHNICLADDMQVARDVAKCRFDLTIKPRFCDGNNVRLMSEDKVVSEITKICAEAPHIGRHDSQVLAEVVNPLLTPGAGLTVDYMGMRWRVTACHATWNPLQYHFLPKVSSAAVAYLRCVSGAGTVITSRSISTPDVPLGPEKEEDLVEDSEVRAEANMKEEAPQGEPPEGGRSDNEADDNDERSLLIFAKYIGPKLDKRDGNIIWPYRRPKLVPSR
ncbi:hypothetical protein E2C01_002324 [Portunus trituberculatus]|uniref:Uncharacterized protein n=1 Tax=Portunus trituberculatus TaxID=210409 RepID=A0A5B7CLZ2_PORTR|nr:hypothetical protein [Portunus trituberculatus]